MKNVGVIMVNIGIVLFIDEIGFWLTGIPVGWLLGDWSALHIDPFHHWMWGILMFFGGLGILIADWFVENKSHIIFEITDEEWDKLKVQQKK